MTKLTLKGSMRLNMYKSIFRLMMLVSFSILTIACTATQNSDKENMDASMESLQSDTLVVNDFGYEGN